MNLSMQLPKRQILSFCFFFIVSFLFCHSQSVKNFTISDGLSGNTINCIFKDSKGLLWIGTETGLSTYDGTNFNIIGEKEGLKYNFIWKMIFQQKMKKRK